MVLKKSNDPFGQNAEGIQSEKKAISAEQSSAKDRQVTRESLQQFNGLLVRQSCGFSLKPVVPQQSFPR
jgi:hypothetical protein